MGVPNGFSKSCNTNYSRSSPACSCAPVIVKPVIQTTSPNPDPSRFRILGSYQSNGFLVMLVSYPDATNFEGRKILVYRHAGTAEELLQRTRGELDPHFCQDGTGPVARFEPSEEGAKLAGLLVKAASSLTESKP